VSKRTTLFLVRYRFHIITQQEDRSRALLAEDSQVIAFAGSPSNADWLSTEAAESLLLAEPESNVLPDQATHFVRQVIEGFAALEDRIKQMARDRADELHDAHRRVRAASRAKHIIQHVEPQLPPDVLGIYVYLPVASKG
jgi:hypothetical protein